MEGKGVKDREKLVREYGMILRLTSGKSRTLITISMSGRSSMH